MDAVYYILQQLIPPLDRIFCLVGADVRSWYEEMPKTMRANQATETALFSPRMQRTLQQAQIDEHFLSLHCVLCGEPADEGTVVLHFFDSLLQLYLI